MSHPENKLKSDFVREKTAKLRQLLPKIEPRTLSDQTCRDILRLLHTIKGTSRAFGLIDSSREAHRLETLIENIQTNNPQESPESLWPIQDGIRKLIELLEKDARSASKEDVHANERIEKSKEFRILESIPDEFVSPLSLHEKSVLETELEKGRSLFVVEVGIDSSKLQTEFIQLRNQLSGFGDMIATVPKDSSEQLIFQFVIASNLTREKAEEISQKVGAAIRYCYENVSQDFVSLEDIFKTAMLAGEKIASAQSVKVRFDIASPPQKLSIARAQMISDALVHLVQNAVVHGIRKSGVISLNSTSQGNSTLIRISDNGRGLDLKRVRKLAQKMNLLIPNEELSDFDVAQLVFSYGLSTSDELSEFSGRGIGLNAVKNLVEEMHGTITLHPNPEGGTVVEILLPDEEAAATTHSR